MTDVSPGLAQPQRIDPRAFRDALGAFVTGVTIVTTCDSEGRQVGLTANSFNSVSLDPPLILWSLALNSPSLNAFREAKWWAVHILSLDQEEMSARFARRGIDKFDGLAVSKGPGGIPLLDGAAARFVCRTAFEYEGGDHAIFVGEVCEFDQSQVAPLVYHQGRYGRVLPDIGAASASNDPAGFAQHFIGHLLGRAHFEVFYDVKQEYLARGLSAAEYGVLMGLGLGEAVPMEETCARASLGGVDAPEKVIGALAARGLIEGDNGLLCLTDSAARLMVELIAVAQASQIRLEERLLRNLLWRIIEVG